MKSSVSWKNIYLRKKREDEEIKNTAFGIALYGRLFRLCAAPGRHACGREGNSEVMCFCWNVSMEVSQTVNNPNLDFDIFPMAFPSEDKEPTLQGGIWGLGVFDNGDEARIEAAKAFIRFVAENDTEYSKATLISTYWPVRDLPGIYDNDEIMKEYGIFTKYMGDYYQVTPGWSKVRTEWWHMLQSIGAGEDIAGAVKEFEDNANKAASEALAEK